MPARLAVRTFARRLGSGLVIASALSASAPASAYVRSLTARGCHPVRWEQSCIYVTTDTTPMPEMLLVDRDRIAEAAVQSWQSHSTGFLELRYVPASGPRDAVTDGWQVIAVRTAVWGRPPETADSEAVAYDPSVAALTTLSYVAEPTNPERDGVIIDADIELNAVDNYFYDADANPNPQHGSRKPVDLWNTLTHELGHVQGLDHTCRLSTAALPSCARDNLGDEVVFCRAVEEGRAIDPQLKAIYETTMYPSSSPRETTKRQPKADDLAGLDAMYPRSQDPRVCLTPENALAVQPAATTTPEAPAPSRGCVTATRGQTDGVGAIFAALALLWIGRRASPAWRRRMARRAR